MQEQQSHLKYKCTNTMDSTVVCVCVCVCVEWVCMCTYFDTRSTSPTDIMSTVTLATGRVLHEKWWRTHTCNYRERPLSLSLSANDTWSLLKPSISSKDHNNIIKHVKQNFNHARCYIAVCSILHVNPEFCPHWSGVVGLNHHSALFTTTHNGVKHWKFYTKCTSITIMADC